MGARAGRPGPPCDARARTSPPAGRRKAERGARAVDGTLLDDATVSGMLILDIALSLEDSQEFALRISQARLGQDYSTLKMLLKQVAEHNYKLRGQWQAPRTVFVSHAQCAARKLKVHKPPKISFSTMSTADALLHFSRQRASVVCGLNFANGESPGGGYRNGATAQEEDLCRRAPALYTSLLRAAEAGLYPFGPATLWSEAETERYADVLYTSGLVVARDGERGGFALLPWRDQARVSLVSAAAPNVKFKREVSSPDLIYKTIESILIAPRTIEPQVNTLVLGAWGCGAFGGDPVQVSDLFVRALTHGNLGRLYREIHFAIPCASPRDRNYATFLECFQKHKLQVQVL